jgi:membrane-associated protein
MKTLKSHLHLAFSTDLIAPLALILLYIGFLIFLKGSLPPTEEIIQHAESLYARYGYEVIFLGSILEALVLVNLIAPGSLAVGLGAVFARTGQLDLIIAVFSAFLGVMLAYIVNFFLGYFGFGGLISKVGYKHLLEGTKKEIEKDKIKTFGIGFIHPNVGALVSLAAGSAKMKFASFFYLAALSSIAWISFWAILIYSLGEVVLRLLTRFFPLIILLILSAWILSILYSRREKSSN